MEMTIPTVCLGSYSANVCPHTFGKEGVFPIEFKIYKVGSSRRIYCSFPVSVKQNTSKYLLR